MVIFRYWYDGLGSQLLDFNPNDDHSLPSNFSLRAPNQTRIEPCAALRPTGKERGGCIINLCDRRVTPPVGMRRQHGDERILFGALILNQPLNNLVSRGRLKPVRYLKTALRNGNMVMLINFMPRAMARLIEADPDLASIFIRRANSATFGRGGPCISPTEIHLLPWRFSWQQYFHRFN